jgi:ABC-2 type transport system ATP-binding protein
LQDFPIRRELVQRFDLDESKKNKALSKGNRQKVGIIQAFMHDPDLLIMDEPSAGLDPLLQNEFNKLLIEWRDRGKTIFFSSHILSEVEKVCDYVSVIRRGKLISTEHILDLNKHIGKKIIVKTVSQLNPAEFDFPGLKFIKKNGENYIFLVQENSKEIINYLNNKPSVIDLSIPESSIEDYFMNFYAEEDV